MHNRFSHYFLCLFAGVSLCGTALAQDFSSEVIVESLPELSLNTLGTVPTQNNLLWSNTPAEKLLSLIDNAGKADLTPAQRALAGHLIQLDVAGAPFKDETQAIGTNRFLIARLKALHNQGLWSEALQLINLLNESDITREISQIKISSLFLKGEEKEACRFLNELPESQEESENIWADKMRISCFLSAEEKEKAVLAYDIFQDAYPQEGGAFASLADIALRELPAELPQDLILNTEDVYLYALTKKKKLDLSKQTQGIKKTLSELPITDIVFRITIGEQIGLSETELKRLYHLPLIKPDLDNPVVQRVLTYNQIFSSDNMDEKARLLFSYLALVKKDGLLVPLAPLIAAALHQIEPAEKYTDLALNAVQAYALTNNASAAEPWFKLLKKSDHPLHEEQYLYAALILQTTGNSYPYDFEDRLTEFCTKYKTKKCAEIKSFLPEDMLKKMSNAPLPVVLHENEPDAFSTRLGEFLLESILAIQKNKKSTPDYLFIQKAARPQEGAAIIREGLVF